VPVRSCSCAACNGLDAPRRKRSGADGRGLAACPPSWNVPAPMTDTTPTPAEDSEPLTTPPEPVLARIRARHIVLIGMMGAGKSAIGRRLGKVLAMPFLDSDTEIEKAAGMKIPDIFETQGEAY